MIRLNKIASGSIFILSEEEYISINELYDLVFCEIYGKKSNLIHLPKWSVWLFVYITNMIYFIVGRGFFFKPWMLCLADRKYRFDINNVKNALKWQPEFQLKKHIKIIVEKLKDNPERWLVINNIK